jgi:hypothetical protein
MPTDIAAKLLYVLTNELGKAHRARIKRTPPIARQGTWRPLLRSRLRNSSSDTTP